MSDYDLPSFQRPGQAYGLFQMQPAPYFNPAPGTERRGDVRVAGADPTVRLEWFDGEQWQPHERRPAPLTPEVVELLKAVDFLLAEADRVSPGLDEALRDLAAKRSQVIER